MLFVIDSPTFELRKMVCTFLTLYVNMNQVTFTEEHVPFLHFLTNVCAIVGGI